MPPGWQLPLQKIQANDLLNILYLTAFAALRNKICKAARDSFQEQEMKGLHQDNGIEEFNLVDDQQDLAHQSALPHKAALTDSIPAFLEFSFVFFHAAHQFRSGENPQTSHKTYPAFKSIDSHNAPRIVCIVFNKT